MLKYFPDDVGLAHDSDGWHSPWPPPLLLLLLLLLLLPTLIHHINMMYVSVLKLRHDVLERVVQCHAHGEVWNRFEFQSAFRVKTRKLFQSKLFELIHSKVEALKVITTRTHHL